MVTPVVNLRHHRFHCFRDFPPGCGPGAAVAAQRKAEEEPPCPAPAMPLHPPPPPPAAAADAADAAGGVDQSTNSGEGTPMANGAVPVVMVLAEEKKDEAPVVDLVKVTRNAETEFSDTLECSRLPVVQIEGDKESRGITGSFDKAVKSKSLELLDNIPERNGRIAGTTEQAESNGSGQAGDVGTEILYSKLFPPPRRRIISAIRNYPIGCGWNATPMNNEECLKLVPEAALNKDICLPREKMMFTGQVPEGKLEVPVVHQVINVSTAKEAQSSQSPSHVVGSPCDSSVVYKERNIPPSSTLHKLQKSKEKDMELNKRKYYDKVNDECQVTINQKINNEVSKDPAKRVMVQALMASPNCPWAKIRRSGASGSRPAVGKAEVKIDKPRLSEDIVYERSNQLSLIINSTVLCGSTTQNDKSIDRGRASLGKHLVVTELEDTEDSLTEYEDGESDDETVALYEGSNEWCVNNPLVVPSYSCRARKDVAARQKVKNSLRLFRKAYRDKLVCHKTQKDNRGKKRMIALTVYNTLKSNGQFLAAGRPIFGDVPGVEVGDVFQLRVELAVVGLHRPLQGGIGSAKKGGISVATSVITSGGCPDDLDSSDVLIYSSSGGITGGANKVPEEDQKLQRGNLSLKNSINTKTPVRVILWFKSGTKQVSTFIYAGLYCVEEYWHEKGSNGFKVFRFKLSKIPGQPELSLQKLKRSTKLNVCKGFCIKDISDGKERVPICLINRIDDDHPSPFNYITEMKYPSGHINTPPKGCECRDDCSDPEKCACARKNGGMVPYNVSDDLMHAKKLVFECGPSCKCSSSCCNRVAQHGIKIPLEIYKTERRGWGVRSPCFIPSGSFICEYIGELLQDEEAEKRGNDEYLFDIGRNCDDPSLWKDLPDHMLDPQTSSSARTLDCGYTIDAAEHGNVGRFFNHSCSPNLYAQNVFYDHDDRRMPHVMLFAGCSIPPFQELTYDYNYKIDGLHDSEGNIRRKDCYCGSAECCGRLY